VPRHFAEIAAAWDDPTNPALAPVVDVIDLYYSAELSLWACWPVGVGEFHSEIFALGADGK
jgi:hypothetical protein